MRLEFKNVSRSIEQFNPVDLPDFTVLTGLNGSGKTQLLEALVEESRECVVIEGIEQKDILFFKHQEFHLSDQGKITEAQIIQAKKELWDLFNKHIKKHVLSAKNELQNYGEIKTLCRDKKKGLWDLTKDDIGDDSMYQQLEKYRLIVEDSCITDGHRDESKSILALAKKLPYSIDEIGENDFLNKLVFYTFNRGLFPENLGSIFLDYYVRCKQKKIKEIPNEKPWNIVNSILERFENFDYRFNSPEGIDLFDEFQFKLVHQKNKDLNVSTSHLSSGEKILLALAACRYKPQSDNTFHKLLLLDEIDLSLHPSVIDILIDIVENVFVQNNTKVILVTHSPTTVALAPEESIFVMHKEGENRIEKTSKESALKTLADGFISLSQEEASRGITYNLEKTELPVLLTEGITDKIILENAWMKLNDKDNIDDMPFYIQDCFNANFLKSLLNNGHNSRHGIFKMNSGKTFVALFDFDTLGHGIWQCLRQFDIISDSPSEGLTKKHKDHNAYALLLPVIDSIKDQIVDRNNQPYENEIYFSIELLFYGIEELEGYFEEKEASDSRRIVKFKDASKTKFAENTKSLSRDNFRNFEPLLKQITEILKKR